MREINRIPNFLKELENLWKEVPDMRFGQFIDNFFTFVLEKEKIDIFFIEDDRMLELLKEYKKNIIGG